MRGHLAVWGPTAEAGLRDGTQGRDPVEPLSGGKPVHLKGAQLKPRKPKSTSRPFLTHNNLLHLMVLNLMFVLLFTLFYFYL